MKFYCKASDMYVDLNYSYFSSQIFKQQFLVVIKRDKVFTFKKDEISIAISAYFVKSLVSGRSHYVSLTPDRIPNRIMFEDSVTWAFSNLS